METLTRRQMAIIGLLLISKLSTGELLAKLSDKDFIISEDSLVRDIAPLRAEGLVESLGSGPARKHQLTTKGRLIAPLSSDDLSIYLNTEREAIHFNHDWLDGLTGSELFTPQERGELNSLQQTFSDFMFKASRDIQKRWYQKWLIEFAWKSSAIEGNSYDVLETETLLLDHIEAMGKTHAEAVMILNHQTAVNYVYEEADSFHKMNIVLLEKVHKLVVHELEVNRRIRGIAVGISGSSYHPLAIRQKLIKETEFALDQLNGQENIWSRSIAMVLAISYLQPFEDGNKRTARIMTNGMLYANKAIPLVLGGIDPTLYRRACIAFYELGNAYLMKEVLKNSWRATVGSLN